MGPVVAARALSVDPHEWTQLPGTATSREAGWSLNDGMQISVTWTCSRLTCTADYRCEWPVPPTIGKTGLIFKQQLRAMALQRFSSASDFQIRSSKSTGDVTIEHKNMLSFTKHCLY